MLLVGALIIVLIGVIIAALVKIRKLQMGTHMGNHIG